MSSQSSNFRRIDVKRAVQAMQTAGLKVGRVELRGGTVRIIPVNYEDDGGETSATECRCLIPRRSYG